METQVLDEDLCIKFFNSLRKMEVELSLVGLCIGGGGGGECEVE
jgi:predicted ATPase